jgi:hypothetical protein
VIALVLAPWTTGFAQSPPVRDFAYGLVLEVDGNGAIYRVAIPNSVYRDATRSDLGDVRVFNGRDEAVPHTVRVPTITLADAPDPRPLPLFPLSADTADTSGGLALDVITDGMGAIIHVGKGPPPKDPASVAAYLIDAGALDRPASELRLTWQSPGERFVTTVAVESSDDLTHWQTLVGTATLAEVRYGAHHLEQRTIAIPNRRFKYLRLTWPEGVHGARLTRVDAVFPRVATSAPRRWATLSSVRTSAQPLTYEFERAGAMPVDRLTIRLPQPNSVVEAVLRSRPDATAPWRMRSRGLLYHLEVNGVTLVNDPLGVAPAADRYWSLEVGPDVGPGDGAPILEVGWIPHDLYFLARGEPPYRLAYGSAGMDPPTQSVDALLRAIDDRQRDGFIKEARVGDQVELGGPVRLVPPPPPLPWKRWVLWGVLVGSVGLLGWMARRLYRQMNAPRPASGQPESGTGPGS